MTYEQIIKALQCCSNAAYHCEKCPFYGRKEDCEVELPEEALNLIKRQKAKINNLKAEIAEHKAMLEAFDNELVSLSKAIKTEKSEAIKEFVHRLKDKVVQKYECTDINIFEEIENLVKEMTEVKQNENQN